MCVSRTVVALGVGMLLPCILRASDSTPQRHVPKRFTTIPQETQLIAPPNEQSAKLLAGIDRRAGAAVPDTERTLPVWPSQKLLLKPSACRDRSAEFPPVFPKTHLKRVKPIKPGAQAPAVAAYDAQSWIRIVISPEWVPQDLGERLLAVQAKDPANSQIVCRWGDQHANSVQVAQTVSLVCVVFKPAAGHGKAESAEELGRLLFQEVLRRETKTPWPRWKRLGTPRNPQGVFVRDSNLRRGLDDSMWSESCVWYADRNAVAVFLAKREGSRPRYPRFGDPWF